MYIRKARQSDLATIERLIHQTKDLQSPTGHDLGPSYNRELIKKGIGLVAEVEEHFGGFLLAEADRQTGYSELFYIAVTPKYRGMKLGARLLEAYLSECKRRKLRIVFTLAPAGNAKAARFFRKHGFTIGKPMTPFSKKLRA